MLKITNIILCCFVMILGCSSPQSTTDIDNELSEIDKKINQANEEYNKAGHLLKNLISIRLNTYQNTKAMLEQKKTGINRFISINYTVNGKPYKLSDDIKTNLKAIETDIEREEKVLNKAEEELKHSGGLVQALNLMKVATIKNTISLLDQKMILYKYGIPLYETDSITKNYPVKVDKTVENKDTKVNTEAEIAKQKESINLQLMNDTLKVVLFKMALLPKDYRIGRYNEELMTGFLYKNNGDKDIRAFTGHIIFKDLFDREFYRVSLTYEGIIKAKEDKRDTNKVIKMNEFDDAHRKLKATELQDMKVAFEPEKILFTDGSKLEK